MSHCPHAPLPLFRRLPHWEAVLVLCLGLLLTACASQKASQKAPELPARHWLDEAPGVPVENREKLAAAVPNLYEPDKVFRFDDCVYLTIQQSPMLVNSAVDLETKKLQLTDAVWQYLPEPRMTMTVSSNLTQYNSSEPDAANNYGQTAFRVGVYARFPNPIGTYFNHQVQKMMVSLAVSAHRKAIGAAIKQIAETYLKLDAQRRIMALQKSLLPLQKELVGYWQQVEAVEGRQGISVNLARQNLRKAELELEKTAMEEVMLRTNLKILAGIDPRQKLILDTSDADSILQNFNGRAIDWEHRWPVTEDELMVRTQVKLQDYNIMIAWATYVPDITIQLNSYPPGGQYQPVNGQDDTFLHLNFDFPLLDWGRRYRGVQTARMGKAKAFHEQARMRTDYSNKWLQVEQRVSMAETSEKLAKNVLEAAEMDAKEAEIAFSEGIGVFPALAERKEEIVRRRIDHIEAELELELAKLEWMNLASILQERYLGLPAKEIK